MSVPNIEISNNTTTLGGDTGTVAVPVFHNATVWVVG